MEAFDDEPERSELEGAEGSAQVGELAQADGVSAPRAGEGAQSASSGVGRLSSRQLSEPGTKQNSSILRRSAAALGPLSDR